MIGTGSTISPKTLPAIASYPATVALLHSTNPITGYNFTLGSLPAATPAYAGTIALNADSTVVQLTLTAGPIGSRPSVTWNGVDALANGNTNWSDAQNWLSPGTPAATENVTFNNTATAAASPFDLSGGVGSGGSVDQVNVNNFVDANLATAALTYGNTGGNFHNTQIGSGKTLTVGGSVFVNGSSGNVSILGAGGTFYVTNSSANFNVEAGTAPTLDMSGLDIFVAKVNQFAIGFDIPSAGTVVNGICYLARTNFITTGVGTFGISASVVIGSADNQSGAGTGTLYLGQTNSLHVDGIVLGAGPAIGDVITFNPVLAGSNPAAFIRGVAGDASRVTLWTLGDDTVNLNNHTAGYGHINDFSGGTLNALVSTLNVGQGGHGNTANQQVEATFSMGAGRLDVTTLNIGVSGLGAGGTGIGVMSVTNGTLLVNTLGFALTGGGQATSSGTLGVTNATLVVSNAVNIGAGTAGATVGMAGSTVKLLNAVTLGTPSVPVVTLNLDGGTLQLNADGNATAARVVASTINTGAATTINIGSLANVTGPVQIPLISYGGADPFTALTLGTDPRPHS